MDKKHNAIVIGAVLGSLLSIAVYSIVKNGVNKLTALERIKDKMREENEAREQALAVFDGNNIELEQYILDKGLRKQAYTEGPKQKESVLVSKIKKFCITHNDNDNADHIKFDWLLVLKSLQDDGEPIEFTAEQERVLKEKYKEPTSKKKYIKRTEYFSVIPKEDGGVE